MRCSLRNTRYVANPWSKPTLGDQSADTLEEAFLKEFGESAVVAASALSSHPHFLSMLSGHGGLWGKKTVVDLLGLEESIRKRHQETQDSLDSILGA